MRGDIKDVDPVQLLDDTDQVVASRGWHRSPDSVRSDPNRTVRITVEKLKAQLGGNLATPTEPGNVFINSPSPTPTIYLKEEVDALIGTLVFDFPAPSNQWVINHGLNRFPDVMTVMPDGSERWGDLVYVSANQIIVNWGANYSGHAYLQ